MLQDSANANIMTFVKITRDNVQKTVHEKEVPLDNNIPNSNNNNNNQNNNNNGNKGKNGRSIVVLLVISILLTFLFWRVFDRLSTGRGRNRHIWRVYSDAGCGRNQKGQNLQQ